MIEPSCYPAELGDRPFPFRLRSSRQSSIPRTTTEPFWINTRVSKSVQEPQPRFYLVDQGVIGAEGRGLELLRSALSLNPRRHSHINVGSGYRSGRRYVPFGPAREAGQCGRPFLQRVSRGLVFSTDALRLAGEMEHSRSLNRVRAVESRPAAVRLACAIAAAVLLGWSEGGSAASKQLHIGGAGIF